MSYGTQAQLSRDPAIRERLAAAAAKEGVTDPHPTAWADANQWILAAEPGWDEAYSYAIATDVPNPGADESVITDAMILAAVQKALGITPPAESPPVEPEPPLV